MSSYSDSEMMIVTAARALEGARSVLVGVGLPNIACNLARRTIAQDLELIYESGVFGAQPARLPLSIGDPTIVSGAKSVVAMRDLFLFVLQGGWVDAALLGTAQIDRYGNLNTTVIGPYANPKVRLPGSGGACEIATNARYTLIITRLSQRTFVEQLDFITTVGHKVGDRSRRDLSLPGAGPRTVITDRAIFDFEPDSGEMRLSELHPGFTIEQIQTEVSWELLQSKRVGVTEPPTAVELRIIRDDLDPQGMFR